jgi:hypothetical protein
MNSKANGEENLNLAALGRGKPLLTLKQHLTGLVARALRKTLAWDRRGEACLALARTQNGLQQTGVTR